MQFTSKHSNFEVQLQNIVVVGQGWDVGPDGDESIGIDQSSELTGQMDRSKKILRGQKWEKEVKWDGKLCQAGTYIW